MPTHDDDDNYEESENPLIPSFPYDTNYLPTSATAQSGSQYHHVGNISTQHPRPYHPPPLPSGQPLLDTLYGSSINPGSGTPVVTHDEPVAPTARELTSMSNTPASQSRSYGCLLCPGRFRKEMNRGNFKRHVRVVHNHDRLFFCLADRCNFDNQRPDKVREHVVRFHRGTWNNPNDGVSMERVKHAPSQLVCPQCNTQHENWDIWFACFESHCQL
jgi:hypothetical protein